MIYFFLFSFQETDTNSHTLLTPASLWSGKRVKCAEAEVNLIKDVYRAAAVGRPAAEQRQGCV